MLAFAKLVLLEGDSINLSIYLENDGNEISKTK